MCVRLSGIPRRLLQGHRNRPHPSWRAQGLGVYRSWRDLGYAAGAVIAGLLAQALGLSAAVIAGGVLTLACGLLAARRITSGSPHVATPGPATALRC